MRYFLSLFAVLLALNVSAATPEETVQAAMSKLAPQVKVDVVQESVVPGFYEAIIGSQFLYVSKDGRFVLDGSALDAQNERDITEGARARNRMASLKQISADKRIIFAPSKPKYSVTVFTDIDCPFCRRFHQQIEAYNNAGIAVEYVFMPLDIHPGADKKAEAVWCAADRKSAFTSAMNGGDPGNATCENPVEETTRLAQRMGINGTPTMLAPDGSRIAPQIALAPERLVAELEHIAKNPVAPR
ncbi:MAG: DsbC family protein [Dokdonella sp.]|uniref:DsbC family protein n=1 Tax=Dokdonella sp. TaxID=2291710 RepID=UPI002CA8233B|nr:DsbC family protein [Dokdonella sp.]HOX71119.1 DsbC family protein [Dokdonella sp.]HPN79428.1 DsbC family protein [Dokdonella sp.]